MSILGELISPQPVDEFLRQNLGKQPFASPYKAARFEGLISWPLLERIFSSDHKNCWLANGGKLHPKDELSKGKITIEQAKMGFTEGYTVLVRHSERVIPELTEIAADFFDIFDAPIDIQLYATPAGEQGFDWHFDKEDVFVLQSSGEKEFRLRKDLNPAPGEKVQEIRCHLKAGDWLYIPSGYWHKAEAITDSFHLSVGVMLK